MARRFAEDNVEFSVKNTTTRTRFQDEKVYEPAPEEESAKRPGGGKRLALLLAAFILGFAIIGAGVYALVHFVILGNNTTPTETVAPTPTTPPDPTLAPIPTQPETQAPTEPDYEGMAEEYLAGMTVDEKIYQLFIVTPEVLTEVDNVTRAGDATKEAIEEKPVGGIIYFDNNFEDVDQTKTLISNSQSYAKTPMFIAVDEEGGDVARVASVLGTTEFDPMLTYEDKGEITARENARIIASDISSLGFNLDLAPVADVLTNPDNTAIGSRAYSDDVKTAEILVAAAVKGFNEGGVLSVLKHFPGHGGTDEDSHETFAVVNTPVDDLKKGEMLPFKSGLNAGADMVMAGHIIVTELDPDLPATMSPKVVPELLRTYLNYDGVVISDSMSMACLDGYGYDETVKGIFDADIDIILMPDNLEKYVEAIKAALEDGTITQAQIDKKVKRILTLKYKKGVIPEAPSTNAPASSEAPTEAEETPTAVDAAPTEDPDKRVTDNTDEIATAA